MYAIANMNQITTATKNIKAFGVSDAEVKEEDVIVLRSM